MHRAMDVGSRTHAIPRHNVMLPPDPSHGRPVPDLADFERWIPGGFRDEVTGRRPEPHVDGATWLARLPRLVRECSLEWNLVAEGAVRYGACAVVIPVSRDGEPAALKVMWPHTESDHEHLALRAWHGDGAVRLLAADPGRGALLLERLDPDRDLSGIDLLEACETIGHLMRRLDRAALPQLLALETAAGPWVDRLAAGHDAVPRRLTTQAASYLGTLLGAQIAHRLVHQDLHFENVLAATRQPWLAIDPKPIAAPWEFAVAPVLWNRGDETAAAHSARNHLRLRLGVVCESGGLDEETARAWTFVRVVLNAVWAADELPDSTDFISRMLVVAKAMSD